jgi:hypothetical protein
LQRGGDMQLTWNVLCMAEGTCNLHGMFYA